MTPVDFTSYNNVNTRHQYGGIMADKNNKVEGNIAGKYYVDNDCTGCVLCESEAPENFKLNNKGMASVFKQPSKDSENEQCKSALESCPVEAIGDDG